MARFLEGFGGFVEVSLRVFGRFLEGFGGFVEVSLRVFGSFFGGFLVWWSAPYNCRYEGEVQKVRLG